MDDVMTRQILRLCTLALLFVWTEAIGCFRCTSINGRNPECEDTFNNTGVFYVEDCWASRRGRTGLFPGTQCIKMHAVTTNYTVVVRNCVVDDGGTNSETEIGRQSHCGWMRVLKYEGKRMRGCILSCDTDACNHGERGRASWVPSLITAGLSSFFITQRR